MRVSAVSAECASYRKPAAHCAVRVHSRGCERFGSYLQLRLGHPHRCTRPPLESWLTSRQPARHLGLPAEAAFSRGPAPGLQPGIDAVRPRSIAAG